MKDNIYQDLPNGSEENRGKNKVRRTQKQTIFNYLRDKVATASMVTAATGVPQKCITRYKRDFEKLGILEEVYEGYCKDTGHWAWFITTDETKFPKPTQLNLFKK
jgi:hypothetical protein